MIDKDLTREEAERLTDEPEIHDAISNFAQDHTQDNATGIVLAVAKVLRQMTET